MPKHRIIRFQLKIFRAEGIKQRVRDKLSRETSKLTRSSRIKLTTLPKFLPRKSPRSTLLFLDVPRVPAPPLHPHRDPLSYFSSRFFAQKLKLFSV